MNPSGYSPNGSRTPSRTTTTGTGRDADGVAGGDWRGEKPELAEFVPSVSTALGEAWAHDVTSALRAQTRDIVGSWPGTMREARSRVLAGLPAARRSAFDAAALDALARAVYTVARRSWDAISEPDPEP